jgi:hypothetical protein
MTCLVVLAVSPAEAQIPKTASVGFNNKTDLDVIIQGYTIVNGSKRYGPPLRLTKKGSMAFDYNVPGGYRYYTVFDATKPGTVLLPNFPVTIQNREMSLDLVQMSNRLMIVPSSQ